MDPSQIPGSLTNGPLFRVRFGESLVFRLYSEIDHFHLSSEAQGVSHVLPLGDCHTVCVRRNAHLIPIFCGPCREGELNLAQISLTYTSPKKKECRLQLSLYESNPLDMVILDVDTYLASN